MCVVAGSSRRVTSVAIWTDAKSVSFIHAVQTYTVLGLLRAGLKMFCGLAAEARSYTCMKAYLVNAADPVLTVSIEFGIQETDPARAACIIVEHMKTDPQGVRLHKCEPLYWHCCNVFEEVITEPVASSWRLKVEYTDLTEHILSAAVYFRHLGSSTAANWVSFDLNVSCSSC